MATRFAIRASIFTNVVSRYDGIGTFLESRKRVSIPSHLSMLPSRELPTNSRNQYHPVSWSWIVGGITDRVSCHARASKQPRMRIIEDVVQTNVVKALGTSGEMYLGRVPEHAFRRLCLLEKRRSARCSSLRDVVGAIESAIFRWVGNSSTWRQLCLPSSNGAYTARAVACAYGALANDGRVRDACLLSPATTRRLFDTVSDKKKWLTNESSRQMSQPARLGLGFSPWATPDLHGENVAHQCLGHSGMGGFHAYADPTRQLGVCIFSSVYEPISLEKSSRLIQEACEIIRKECDRHH